MVGVMPSEQELRQRIEKSRPVEKVDKLVHQAQMRAIMENVNSDRPIWDVRFPTKQDLVPNDSIVESKTPVGSPRI